MFGPLRPYMIEVARNHVDDRTGNEEGRNLAHAAGRVFFLGRLDQRQPADAGTDGDADPLGVGRVSSRPASRMAWMPAAMP